MEKSEKYVKECKKYEFEVFLIWFWGKWGGLNYFSLLIKGSCVYGSVFLYVVVLFFFFRWEGMKCMCMKILINFVCVYLIFM